MRCLFGADTLVLAGVYFLELFEKEALGRDQSMGTEKTKRAPRV